MGNILMNLLIHKGSESFSSSVPARLRVLSRTARGASLCGYRKRERDIVVRRPWCRFSEAYFRSFVRFLVR